MATNASLGNGAQLGIVNEDACANSANFDSQLQFGYQCCLATQLKSGSNLSDRTPMSNNASGDVAVTFENQQSARPCHFF